MMMLYDTLLPDGEYRLGIRYASPTDAVRQPPYYGDEARAVVSTRYVGAGVDIDLRLEPLTQVGTRVIVPYLSQEVVDAFRSGELSQWLQRCWWRAVQMGLTIAVVDQDGSKLEIAVPPWWVTEPWKRRTNGVRVYDNIVVADELKIKRIVLLYDESLSESDPDFWGVQLLRGHQWIETLGQETLSDYVPKDKRSGFRGFVEFDRGAERALRRAENSQHERFDRRGVGVKDLINVITDTVRGFAEEQRWHGHEAPLPAPAGDVEIALRFLRFLSPRARSSRTIDTGAVGPAQLRMDFSERWECALRLDYPDPKSTRVNWGDHIRNLSAIVRLQPASFSRHASVSLELVEVEGGASVVVSTGSVHLQEGEGLIHFGDFQVITGAAGPGKLQCPRKGRWKLTARVKDKESEVNRASRSIFVNEDPPARDANPYTLSIAVENHTTGQRRINSGDTVGVQVSVTNHTPDNQGLELTASIGDLLLADGALVDTQGTPSGGTPTRVAGVQTSVVVNPAALPPSPERSVYLSPGRHALRADLFLNGKPVAHASKSLDIEVDPAQSQDWPPFDIEQIPGDGPHPRWQFHKRSRDEWTLQYPSQHPLYRALAGGPARSTFVVDVCAEGIVEWAMEPLDHGDHSRLDVLMDGIPVGVDPDRWGEYCEGLQRLAALRGQPDSVDKYNQQVRDCAARSLSLFEEWG